MNPFRGRQQEKNLLEAKTDKNSQTNERCFRNSLWMSSPEQLWVDVSAWWGNQMFCKANFIQNVLKHNWPISVITCMTQWIQSCDCVSNLLWSGLSLLHMSLFQVVISLTVFPGDSKIYDGAILNVPVVKFIYLRQVAKQHISFVFKGRGDEVAQFRVVQLCQITLGWGGRTDTALSLSLWMMRTNWRLISQHMFTTINIQHSHD